MTEMVDSASDARTVNNTMRHQYKVLTDAEKASMLKIKDDALALHTYVSSLGKSRELSLALTKIEEAVMWAVKPMCRRHDAIKWHAEQFGSGTYKERMKSARLLVADIINNRRTGNFPLPG